MFEFRSVLFRAHTLKNFKSPFGKSQFFEIPKSKIPNNPGHSPSGASLISTPHWIGREHVYIYILNVIIIFIGQAAGCQRLIIVSISKN